MKFISDLCALYALVVIHGSIAVIPPRRNHVLFDATANQAPNIVARALGRLEDWRAVAARYDNTDTNFIADICFVAVVTYWLH